MPGVAAVLIAARSRSRAAAAVGRGRGPVRTPRARARRGPVRRRARRRGPRGDLARRRQDAAEAVLVELEPLEAVIGPGRPPPSGRAAPVPRGRHERRPRFEESWDEDVLAEADVVARLRVRHQRLAPVPMETNAILVVPDGRRPSRSGSRRRSRSTCGTTSAEWLGLEREAVRVIAPDVGGGFGAKLHVYPEYLVCAAAALRLGRPVTWVETRTESMADLTHGRAQVHDVELGATRDGTLVGLARRHPRRHGRVPDRRRTCRRRPETMLPGVYRIPRVASRGRSVVTSTTPVARTEARGVRRPPLSIERAMDALAAELGIDPVELRRRNLDPARRVPVSSRRSASSYDIGDYERALDEALPDRRLRGAPPRAGRAPSRAGIAGSRSASGSSVYVEVTGVGRKEFGSVEVEPDGLGTVRVGTSSHGPGARDRVRAGRGGGHSACRSSAIARAAFGHRARSSGARGRTARGRYRSAGRRCSRRPGEVLEQARRILAAELLEVAPEDVAPVDGGFGVVGAPDRVGRLGGAATEAADRSPRTAGGLSARARRFQPGVHLPVRGTRRGRRGRSRHRRRRGCSGTSPSTTAVGS